MGVPPHVPTTHLMLVAQLALGVTRLKMFLWSHQPILKIVAFLLRLKWFLCGWPRGLCERSASALTAAAQQLDHKDGRAKYKHRDRQHGGCCKVAVMRSTRSHSSLSTSHECQRAEPSDCRPCLRERAGW